MKTISDRPGVIGVESVQEHEDGSATYQLHMDDKAQAMLVEEGMKLVLHCAAAKVDIADVYAWIISQIPEGDEEENVEESKPFDEYGFYGENNGPLP
jgi:hypothetical protein